MIGGTVNSLVGRVVVVAGEEPALRAVADAAHDAGALVAVVSRTLPDDVSGSVRFRSDPGDPAVWERVAMHVEQHLGPVDGVVTDDKRHDVVNAVFATDLARRGHGTVTVVTDDLDGVLTHLCGTPAAAPAPPPSDGGRR